MAFLRSPKAADRYGLTVGWLNKSRIRGGPDSPPFIKVRGVVLYDTDVLDQWFAARMRGSTSEQRPAADPVYQLRAPSETNLLAKALCRTSGKRGKAGSSNKASAKVAPQAIQEP